jgi:hypothetical protein
VESMRCGNSGSRRSPNSCVSEGSTTSKSELEAAKERKRAQHRAYAKRYADPEYRARIQARARKRLAEKRADPEWHAEYKKRQRRCYRTRGKILPNRQLSKQRAYASSPPIRSGVKGIIRSNARGTATTRRSGQEDALEQKSGGSSGRTSRDDLTSRGQPLLPKFLPSGQR